MSNTTVKDNAGNEVDRYRYESGSLFEYKPDHNAYVCVYTCAGGKRKAVREYEESLQDDYLSSPFW